MGLAAPIMFNPNTGAPIMPIGSAAAPTSAPPLVIMRNPNTGAPIYPASHGVLLMQAGAAHLAQVQAVAVASAQAAMPQQQSQQQQKQQQPGAASFAAGRASPNKPAGGGRGGNGGGRGAGGGAGRGRPQLAPPAKRLRKKDVALPPDKLTENPVARAPQSASEAAEVDQ
jgi:hypothetical protein